MNTARRLKFPRRRRGLRLTPSLKRPPRAEEIASPKASYAWVYETGDLNAAAEIVAALQGFYLRKEAS